MVKPSLTIAAIRDVYPEEKRLRERNNLWGYWVVRQVSYYLAWLFLKLGISANSVTFMGFISGLVGCGLLAFGSHVSIIIGALLINLWALFDYVDGNIARYSGSVTKYGEFIDNISGYIIETLLFICIGIGTFNYPDQYFNSIVIDILHIDINASVLPLILGGWASLFVIFIAFVGDRFAKIFQRNQANTIIESRRSTSSKVIKRVGTSIATLHIPLLILAAIFCFLGVFLLFYALIFTLAFVVRLSQLIKEARSISGNNFLQRTS